MKNLLSFAKNAFTYFLFLAFTFGCFYASRVQAQDHSETSIHFFVIDTITVQMANGGPRLRTGYQISEPADRIINNPVNQRDTTKTIRIVRVVISDPTASIEEIYAQAERLGLKTISPNVVPALRRSINLNDDEWFHVAMEPQNGIILGIGGREHIYNSYSANLQNSKDDGFFFKL